MKKDQVDEANQDLSDENEYGSSSDSDSNEEMSFTSDEDNTDALKILALCADVEKKKLALKEQELTQKSKEPELKNTTENTKSKKSKNEKVAVTLNTAVDQNDLSLFNTTSKRLIKEDAVEGSGQNDFKNLFITEDENAVLEQFEKEKN